MRMCDWNGYGAGAGTADPSTAMRSGRDDEMLGRRCGRDDDLRGPLSSFRRDGNESCSVLAGEKTV
jgi:hypothetical protein